MFIEEEIHQKYIKYEGDKKQLLTRYLIILLGIRLATIVLIANAISSFKDKGDTFLGIFFLAFWLLVEFIGQVVLRRCERKENELYKNYLGQ